MYLAAAPAAWFKYKPFSSHQNNELLCSKEATDHQWLSVLLCDHLDVCIEFFITSNHKQRIFLFDSQCAMPQEDSFNIRHPIASEVLYQSVDELTLVQDSLIIHKCNMSLTVYNTYFYHCISVKHKDLVTLWCCFYFPSFKESRAHWCQTYWWLTIINYTIWCTEAHSNSFQEHVSL